MIEAIVYFGTIFCISGLVATLTDDEVTPKWMSVFCAIFVITFLATYIPFTY